VNAPVNPREAIGGNRPPLVTEASLEIDFKDAIGVIDDLHKRANDVPLVCEDEEDVAALAAIVKTCRASERRAEELRKATKEPYHQAGKVVDGFFNKLTGRVTTLKTSLETRINSYQRKKADAERKAREAEAQRLAEEAAKKQAEALAAAQSAPAGQNTPHVANKMYEASEASRAAEQATVAAAAKPADLARSKTDGATATLVEEWTFSIENFAQIDLEKLRTYFGPADIEKAVRSFVRNGGRDLAGVKIFTIQKTRVT